MPQLAQEIVYPLDCVIHLVFCFIYFGLYQPVGYYAVKKIIRKGEKISCLQMKFRNGIHIHQLSLKRFQRELMDVEDIPEFHIETGDFLTFADYFFDGFVADMLVQSKINEAKRQVENAIQKVNYIMAQLNGL